MDHAQHFINVAGPPGLVLAIWKKGKRAEFAHANFVRGTIAPGTAAPYGKAAWTVRGRAGGGASAGVPRRRRRPDTVADLSAEEYRVVGEVRQDDAAASARGYPVLSGIDALKPSSRNPTVLRREFVCDGGHKAHKYPRAASFEMIEWKKTRVGAVRCEPAVALPNKPSRELKNQLESTSK